MNSIVLIKDLSNPGVYKIDLSQLQLPTGAYDIYAISKKEGTFDSEKSNLIKYLQGSNLILEDNEGVYRCLGAQLDEEKIIISAYYDSKMVVEIAGFAFGNLINVKEIWIPKTVTKIGDLAFSENPNLELIGYDGTIQEWNDIEKSNLWNVTDKKIKIFCSDGEFDYEWTN